jgi:DNA-binding MarR family transcriptional regulator
MENEKMILMEKYMHLAMLLRRLSAPRFGQEGPRGRSQERALTQIALRDGISQRELMERLGVQPSSLSELLGKLEKGGMISKTPMPEDHRNVNLHISETGKKYLERLNDRDRELIPFDALSQEEEAALDAILDKLIESADQGLSMHPPRPLPVRPIGDENGPRRPEPHVLPAQPYGRGRAPRAPFSCPPRGLRPVGPSENEGGEAPRPEKI